MTQIKEKKNDTPVVEKKTIQSGIFHISFIHSERNAKNQREKSRKDVSVNLLKI